MQWSDISFAPSSRTLRQFAGLLIIVFGGLAGWHGLVRGHVDLAMWFAGVAGVIGPLGLVVPQAVRPLYVAWMVVVFPLGWTVSRVLLALLFYGLFTPIGLVFRMMGRDKLQRRFHADRDSYWAPKIQPTDVRSYLRQF